MTAQNRGQTTVSTSFAKTVVCPPILNEETGEIFPMKTPLTRNTRTLRDKAAQRR